VVAKTKTLENDQARAPPAGLDGSLGTRRGADALEHDLARELAGLDHLDVLDQLADQAGGLQREQVDFVLRPGAAGR
jgi:hypothetical protein